MQEGKLSQEAALAYAEKCGIVTPKDVSRTMSLSKNKEVFNFSVYKWNKVRTVQRLILQVIHVYIYIYYVCMYMYMYMSTASTMYVYVHNSVVLCQINRQS